MEMVVARGFSREEAITLVARDSDYTLKLKFGEHNVARHSDAYASS